ncbi:MAG: hypothetical protein G01um101470_683 [Parcubacteria group bacterium Gr01-1014_70]|nr:MAG: hypothetical protein G01um101470_683 [Parcubacteria group bacterium Gr01-1014_70]
MCGIVNLMTLEFVRTKEDFVCENCGYAVVGNGYTNHCPVCLWSKHVDVNPGDRAEPCAGLMKPVSFAKRREKFSITHQCILCGAERRNIVSEGDNIESLLG